MAAIETTDLTKRYGDLVAVDGLSLSVEEGEVFGFLGPNGAGKSTTIDMLLNYTPPSGGEARVLGHDAQSETMAVHRRIGVLPDDFELYGRLSGRRHVEFAIDSKDADDDPAAIIDRVGLDPEDAERPASEYSKGMAKRLALGMALVGDPDLLILDEPSGGLDPHGIQEMQDIVRAEAESGTTVFFSSHILGQVEAVCDRVGILSDGQLAAVDTIEGLRETAGTGAKVTMEVDGTPDADIAEIDGVADVTTDGEALVVSCHDPTAKAEAIARANGDGATVRDVHIEETSLEDLFTMYTTGADADRTGESGTGRSDADGQTTEQPEVVA
jgi:ABC-2 type transport system ATP-binding protein